MSYTMRATLTISLPPETRREIAQAARRRKLSESEFVRRALQAQLWSDAFEASRRKLLPRARARGIYSDEDVFKLVS
jgi:Arc/MetJ-type ribon-helix-helix transcriptional regulator